MAQKEEPGRLECSFERFRIRGCPVYVYRREGVTDHRSSIHRHDFPQIWYCYRGQYFHRIEDQDYECKEGSVVIVPAGTLHQVAYDEDADIMCLSVLHNVLDLDNPGEYKHSVANLFLRAFAQELGLPFQHYITLSPQSRLIMEDVFSWFVLLSYAPDNKASDVQIRQRLEELFSLPEFAIPPERWKKVSQFAQTRLCPIMRVVSYLNEHYSEKITDEKLLQVANISRAVMYRYFKRLMKITYSQYLQNLRSRHARIYIKDTTYSLSKIAELCGFYDSYHMSQNFTRYIGRTVGDYRSKMATSHEKQEKR